MKRPAGKHVRAAERAAYAAGARRVEWRQGGRHHRMVITLDDGWSFMHPIATRVSERTMGAYIALRIRQRIKQEHQKRKGAACPTTCARRSATAGTSSS